MLLYYSNVTVNVQKYLNCNFFFFGFWVKCDHINVFLNLRSQSKVICYVELIYMTQVDGQTHTLRGHYLSNMLSISLLIFWRQTFSLSELSAVLRAIWPVSVSLQCDIGHNWPCEGEAHAGPRMTLSRPVLLWSFQVFLCLHSVPRPLKALCFTSSLGFSAHTMHYAICEMKESVLRGFVTSFPCCEC